MHTLKEEKLCSPSSFDSLLGLEQFRLYQYKLMSFGLWRFGFFWATFYLATKYAKKDPNTNQYVHPSYEILKQQLVIDQIRNGFNEENFSKAYSKFKKQLWKQSVGWSKD